MRSSSSLAQRRRRAAPRRGVALLLVLVCLILLVTLVVGLLVSSQNNFKSSKLYANGSSVKTLADSTVSLVMGQIQQATSNGTMVAWASQPGMIRTYSSAGAPLTNYRLFSWDAPTVSGSYVSSSDESQLATWSSSPAVFVDLNQPEADANGTLHYPIVDGNPADLTSYVNPSGTNVMTYESPSSSTGTNPAIEGFWVNTAAVATTNNNDIPMPVKWLYVLQDGSIVAPVVISGTSVTVTGASATNPIVGRIAYWTDDETSKININTASEGNFWDTPRANGVMDFNFASYQPAQNEFQRYPGHPATTCLSTVFGSLSYVNHALQAVNTNGGLSHSSGTSSNTLYSPYQFYYDLAPKLNTDNSPNNLGSQAGSVIYSTTVTTTTALTTKYDRLYATPDELQFESGLFTDVTHTPLGNVGSTTNSSVPRVVSDSVPGVTITPAMMEKAKFFITASSRAPDVNLYNQPRIVCWPESSTTNSSYRTVWDQAAALCGTINGYSYYFQRSNNSSPVFDLDDSTMTRNRSILSYFESLDKLPVPGFSSSTNSTFYNKYPVANNVNGTSVSEMYQIETEIFDYIRCINLNDQSTSTMTNPFAATSTKAGTDGFGNTVSNNSGSGSGQVVPIYDKNTNTKGFGRFPTIQEVSLMFVATGWNDGHGGLSSDINYWGTSTGTNTNLYSSAITFTSNSLNPGALAPFGFYSNDVGTNSMYVTSSNCPNQYYTAQPTGTRTRFPTIPDGNIQMQAILLLSFFDPSQGNVIEHPTLSVQAIGLGSFNWGISSTSNTSMGFPVYPNDITNAWGVDGGGVEYKTLWGGNMGFRTFMSGWSPGQAVPSSGTASGAYYPFISSPQNFPYTSGTPSNPGSFYFSGGTITLALLLPSGVWPTSGTPSGWPTNSESIATRAPIQQIKISFPSAYLPLPTYPGWVTKSVSNNGVAEDRGSLASRMEVGSNPYGPNCEFTWGGTNGGNSCGDVVRSVRACPGDIRMIAGQVSLIDTGSAATPGYFDSVETKISNSGLTAWYYGSSSPVYRMVHSLRESTDFPFYGASLGAPLPGPGASSSTNLGYNQQVPVGNSPPYFTQGNPPYLYGLFWACGAGNCALATGAQMTNSVDNGAPGDWDNGLAYTADGSFINKPDEGLIPNTGSTGTSLPYFINSTDGGGQAAGITYFSPNRLMPGPGMFGSLPTGVVRNQPWMNLLFCPNPPAGPGHPGFGTDPNGNPAGPSTLPPYNSPPDHLLLDRFYMPVVEPYPISEPLSTAGRINMNYQIVPFTYIERSTGVRAVLKSELMTVIPDSAAGSYKAQEATGINSSPDATTNWNFRYPINADQTLLAFDNYFATNNDIFRSASQICQMFLYPTADATSGSPLGSAAKAPTWDSANLNITKFWNGNTSPTNPSSYTNLSTGTTPTHFLTGENSRERPYTTIYPRLTTKSNTFTVHYWVQTLKQARTSADTAAGWQTWREGTDVITGENRGSSIIERYVDVNDTSLPDFTSSTYANTALDSWYRFHVITNTQFAP